MSFFVLQRLKLNYSPVSKHALKIFSSIAQVEALLSEDVAHQVIWGKIANWSGGSRLERLGLGLEEEQILVYLHNTSKHIPIFPSNATA